jgi:hypothetical protein
MKVHCHSFYQLIWFYSNEEGKHIVDFNSFDIKKADYYLYQKNRSIFLKVQDVGI